MRFVGWLVVVVVIVGIIALNASRSSVPQGPYESEYQDRNSDGQVVCFDDGAGGMNCS